MGARQWLWPDRIFFYLFRVAGLPSFSALRLFRKSSGMLCLGSTQTGRLWGRVRSLVFEAQAGCGSVGGGLPGRQTANEPMMHAWLCSWPFLLCRGRAALVRGLDNPDKKILKEKKKKSKRRPRGVSKRRSGPAIFRSFHYYFFFFCTLGLPMTGYTRSVPSACLSRDRRYTAGGPVVARGGDDGVVAIRLVLR
jgi:hypothetical protein